jgi:hypothetical protein
LIKINAKENFIYTIKNNDRQEIIATIVLTLNNTKNQEYETRDYRSKRKNRIRIAEEAISRGHTVTGISRNPQNG